MQNYTVVGVWVDDDTPVAVAVFDGVVTGMDVSYTEAREVHLVAGVWREVITAQDSREAAINGERIMREANEEELSKLTPDD